jgi:hypothetical protein
MDHQLCHLPSTLSHTTLQDFELWTINSATYHQPFRTPHCRTSSYGPSTLPLTINPFTHHTAGLRAMDLLASKTEIINPSRIGMFGCSGGGTQTMCGAFC